MFSTRTLILGSAAGLLAISGAQAADLPVKAKAVEYVRICSLYGAGFFYIPGTDTCIKLGGYLRADVTFNGSIHGQPAWSSDLGQQNRYRDYFAARSRMALSIDTRTATEYGVVRTFGQGDFQFGDPGQQHLQPGLASTEPRPALAATPACSTPPGRRLRRGGVPFHPVRRLHLRQVRPRPIRRPGTVSRAISTSSLLGGNNTDTGTNNIQYTAQFGNGVSGTRSASTIPRFGTGPSVANLGPSGLAVGGVAVLGCSANAYAGTHAPDVVGNIRVDQAWGLFQISAAALHEVNGSYNLLNAVDGSGGCHRPCRCVLRSR